METLENILASKLLKIKAIKLQPNEPFTWASGWKSPFYCDNRKTLSYPELRTFVKLELSRLVAENIPRQKLLPELLPGLLHREHLLPTSLHYPSFMYAPNQKTTDLKTS